MTDQKLVALTKIIGEAVKEALDGLDLRDFGVYDAEALDIGVLLVHDRGTEYDTAFIATLPSRADVEEMVRKWLNTPDDDALKVM